MCKQPDCCLLQQAYVLLPKLQVITIRDGFTSHVVVTDILGEHTGTPSVPYHFFSSYGSFVNFCKIVPAMQTLGGCCFLFGSEINILFWNVCIQINLILQQSQVLDT